MSAVRRRDAHGFVIPLPCDVHVRDGVLSWDWDLPPLSVDAQPRSPLSFHAPAQVAGTPFFDRTTVIVKFNSFWTIELEPGYSLFATHPVNRADLPFRMLTGMVDCDRFSDVGVLFPAVLDRSGIRGAVPRGTPVAQCFPVAREALELICEPFSPEDARAYRDTARELLSEPGVYRKKFRVKRGSVNPPSERRNLRRSSHNIPFAVEGSACAMRPKVSGRRRIARR